MKGGWVGGLRLRNLPLWLVLAGGLALAAGAVAVLVAVGAPVWARILGVAVVAALTVTVEYAKWLDKKRSEEDDEARGAAGEEARWQQSARECFTMWPAPPVREADPHQLGVKRSAIADKHRVEGAALPPYVGRDIDVRAAEHLQGKGLLLLVGAPASGVTRTAYHLARRVPGERLILAPEPPDGLKTALNSLDVLARIGPKTPLVLWLDRIDKFAGGGVTAKMLRLCREKSPGLRVVATIPSGDRYTTWVAENHDLVEMFGTPVQVRRLLSDGERARAEGAYPGVDFTEGIAAAFSATGALLARLTAGYSTCPHEPDGGDCALARTVVDVAVGWTGTGTTRALPAGRLRAVAVLRHGGATASAEAHLAAALAWAAKPVVEGAAILRVTTDADGVEVVAAHRELAEVHLAQGEGPDRAVWQAALDDAAEAGDSEALGRVGFHAHVNAQLEVAGNAWARVGSLDEPAAAWLTKAADRSKEKGDPKAEVPARQRLLELTESAHGPDHPEVAAALTNLGIAWRGLGQAGRARELDERALRIKETLYGPDHPEVASTLGNLGNAWSELGDNDKARAYYERALAIMSTHFPHGHPNTRIIVRNLLRVAPDLVILDNGTIVRDEGGGGTGVAATP